MEDKLSYAFLKEVERNRRLWPVSKLNAKVFNFAPVCAESGWGRAVGVAAVRARWVPNLNLPSLFTFCVLSQEYFFDICVWQSRDG